MSTELHFIKLDVSQLAPPEPMSVILMHLAKLAKHECLLIKHRRQPFPLYEKLSEAGFLYYCVMHTEDNISLFIFHQQSQSAFDEWLNKHDAAVIYSEISKD